MNRYYWLLLGAIICEVFGTNMMKASNGFSQPLETVLFAIGYIACFILLTFALKGLPLGVAYGVWSGAGVAATAAIGIVFWGDPVNFIVVLGIALIIGGVVLLESSQEGNSSESQA